MRLGIPSFVRELEEATKEDNIAGFTVCFEPPGDRRVTHIRASFKSRAWRSAESQKNHGEDIGAFCYPSTLSVGGSR